MNASDVLLAQWSQQVKEIFPALHHYQQEALAFSVQGIIQSGNAVLQKVAESAWEHLSSETKMVSHERRLQRFVANERIEVKTCWNAFLQHVLPFWQNKPTTLILDLTPYTQEATIVYLGLMLHSRVLPIAWCVMPQQTTWEQGQWEIVGQLFEQVAPFLTAACCTLIADRGLSCLKLVELCQKVGWHYVLRIKQDEWFRKKVRGGYSDWQHSHKEVKHPGEQWFSHVLLWQEHQFPVWLSVSWEVGYEQAWLIISDRRASRQRIRKYAGRMKVEATFQDTKSRGCFIECSRFTNREHLDRWLLVVFVAIWWIAHLGRSCIHHGHREQVDRKDRRDKGLLRIGRLWLKAILKKANRDWSAQTHSRVCAQVANCLPFSHRDQRLYFSIYLQ